MKLSRVGADFPDFHENGQKMVKNHFFENRSVTIIRMVVRTIQKNFGADSGIFVGGIENLRRGSFETRIALEVLQEKLIFYSVECRKLNFCACL